MRSALACFLAAFFGGLTAVWFMQSPGPDFAHAAIQKTSTESGPSIEGPELPGGAPTRTRREIPLESLEEAINIRVYEMANRSVVNITTKSVRSDGFLFEVEAEGNGSGCVIDTDGHILTNYHVIEDAKQVGVMMYDGKSYEAHFVGADPVNDLAVIKVDAPQDVLHPVSLGDSGKLKVGMRVFAIGNPFGLERTLTTGIVSSINRSLKIRRNRTIKSIIQIDASINPGNSGGPLLNTRGELIGLNTAIASSTGQSAGVGFAIPVNLIHRIVPQLIANGRVIRPETGIAMVFKTDEGLQVAALTPGGPAEEAGIQGPELVRRRRGPFVIEQYDRSAADLIVAVDGQKVANEDDFLGIVESKSPGETVVLTIIRGEETIKVPLKLGGE